MTRPDSKYSDSMTAEEMSEFLQSHGHGVLSLADDAGVYGVPVSFGYTDEKDVIYLYLHRFAGGSKTLDVLERTDRASLVAYEVTSRDDWRSVSVTGKLENLGKPGEMTSMSEVADPRYIHHVMQDNAWFPDFSEASDEVIESRVFLFLVDEMSGRQGKAVT